MIDGLRALGLDSEDVRFILISHAHGDHDPGAAIFQRQFGTEIVKGNADWESTLARTEYPGGVPKLDIGVGPDGLELTLGDTTIDVIATPGNTPGTLLMSNHTEFDRAYDRARIAQLCRLPGERHPYETGVDTVVRYFELSRDWAEAERLLRE